MEQIAIYGAGGFGQEVACILHAINKIEPRWEIIGFFDDNASLAGKTLRYGKVLGGIEKLNSRQEPLAIVMAIASAKTLEIVLNKINNPNIKFPNIIAPDVLFYDYADVTFGVGNLIGFRCLVSYNTKFGNFNLFNNDVFVGHDTSIGNFNIFNPSVRISGEVEIGNLNFFGVSSVVLQQKKIGNNTLIATNSVIMRNTADNCKYLGNPAMRISI